MRKTQRKDAETRRRKVVQTLFFIGPFTTPRIRCTSIAESETILAISFSVTNLNALAALSLGVDFFKSFTICNTSPYLWSKVHSNRSARARQCSPATTRRAERRLADSKPPADELLYGGNPLTHVSKTPLSERLHSGANRGLFNLLER